MEHCRGQLAADALAERQLTDRCVQERIEVEHVAEAREVRPVALGGDLVDVAQQLEGVDERQVPPELHALPEHRADPARELDPPSRRVEPRDRDSSRRRHEDTGQHLDRRRLAGPVRAEVAEQLAALDVERDVLDRIDGHALAPEAAPAHHELLREVLDLDHPPALR